ncbi:radical SAM (seleno)protein TrsS [Pelosinus sp. sgz500959]|uniref:radical SAM (seleno)protein TrsS n=1 Tax=Pelosinus sp. sgz500959 TaxID=3242472 RepID=UPI00366A5DEF
MENQENILGLTDSVCPICLKRIPAQRIQISDQVYLKKTCLEHGNFKTIIWRGEPSYQSWSVAKLPSRPPVCATEVNQGCPFDCGLCPEHRQHTCCVLLEITKGCNLSCPVCFAEAGAKDHDPDIKTIENWYRLLLDSGGPYNIQLSGGEPTMRDDLPEIVALGRKLGFSFIQLNTNGIRLARDLDYVKRLKEAGLSCVFLQFDGTNDVIYEKLRDTKLFAEKQAAIAHCAKEQLGVVLVPTLVPEVNTQNIGMMIKYAIENIPAVRGIHFQPISYFGRYPKAPSDQERITIPEVINEMVRQTRGRVNITDFKPPMGENAYCSFHGNFVLMKDGELKSWTKADAKGCCQPQVAAVGAKKAQTFVAKRWAAPQSEGGKDKVQSHINLDSLDDFLDRVENYSFCISGMAFQDVWNLDLERLRECFIHVVSPDRRIIPFCAYNLTDKQGKPLYREVKG